MIKTINGSMFRSIVNTACKLFEINRAQIDSLNVFPVPDGDTGSNMCFTIQSATKALALVQTNKMSDVADAVSKGSLRGARGNSGVILSQIMRGMCSSLKEYDEVDTCKFAKALQSAAEVAYGAVSVPKEGTILTVIKMIAEHAHSVWVKHKDFETFTEELIKKGNEAVEITPTLLPVLAKAGVVDAGGKGLMNFFEGMLKALRGETVEGEAVSAEAMKPVSLSAANDMGISAEHADLFALGDIEFAYCTEFFIINIKKKTTLADIEKLRASLMNIGDCVIVIGDLEFIKVHVHTNKPGRALSMALELGELDKIKIENMLEENREFKKKYEAEKKEIGMLAISSGDGISNIFKDLLVDGILEGGQSMNPSADDIATAAKRINADNIIIFPNNKNIILAAEQAKSLVENKKLHVIPTKSIPQGFSAAMCFNPELSVEENYANMTHAIDTVTDASITYAAKNSKMNGFSIKANDIIGLDNKRILAKGNNIDDVAVKLIDKLRTSEEIITLYYGAEVRQEDAEALQARVQELYPDCDVQLNYGGQPIYFYFISLE